MKSKYLLILSLLGCILSLQAQKTKVFELDLAPVHEDSFKAMPNAKIGEQDSCYVEKGKHCNKRLTIPSNKLIAFKLKNANPFKYRYELNSELVDFFENSNQKFEDDLSKIKDKLEASIEEKNEKQIVGLEPSVKANENFIPNQNTPEEIETQIEKTLKGLQEVEEELGKEVDAIKEIDRKLYERDSLDRFEKASHFPLIEKQHKENSEVMKSKEAFSKILNAYVETQNNTLIENKERRTNKKANLTRQFKTIKEKVNSLSNEFKEAKLMELKTIFNSAILTINKYTNELKEYNRRVELQKIKWISEDYLKYEEFDSIRKIYKDDVNRISDKFVKLNQLVASKLTKDFLSSYRNESKNTFISEWLIAKTLLEEMYSFKKYNYTLPLDFDGENVDVVQLKVKRTPLSNKDSKSDEHNYNIWVTRGFKIDVSAGVFLSTLENQEFEIGMEGNARVINRVNVGRFEYGFGSVANLSYRTGTWVKPTFSFGAMFTTDTQFQFLVGGGLIVGKMNRFVFHYGMSIGRVDRLKNQFTPNEDGLIVLEDANLGDGNITVPELKLGQFFGITYNLGKTKTELPNAK